MPRLKITNPFYMVDQMQEMVLSAKFNFDIYWLLSKNSYRKQHVKTLNQNTLFWHTIIASSIKVAILHIYQLFETRSDTINIGTLIDLVLDKHPEKAPEIIKIKRRIKRRKRIIEAFSIMRNSFYAHKSKNIERREIFKKANITFNETQKHIIFAYNILDEFLVILGRDKNPKLKLFEVRTDLKEILSKLKST